MLDLQVNAAKLNHGENRDVQVLVTGSAQHAGLFLSTNGNSLDLSTVDDRLTLEVAGTLGSREFTFASGTATSAIAAQINTYSDVTGISAAASSTGLVFKSTEFGSNEFVSIDVVNHGGHVGGIALLTGNNENVASTVAANFTSLSAVAATNAVRDAGQDVGAIINGIAATADGKVAKISTDFLDVELELSVSGSQNLASIDAFTITGGGAMFNLGPNVDITNQVGLGIQNVAARNLGSLSNGYLDQLGSSQSANVENGNLEQAQRIVNDSITQVSSLRGRLGAFQKNIVGATIRSLGVALENTSAAESAIRDTDFATETAELTRSQILVNAATNVLAIANSQPQSVLTLLG